MHNYRKLLLLTLLLTMNSQQSLLADSLPNFNSTNDAGVILQHNQEVFKNEKLLKELKEEKTKIREGIEEPNLPQSIQKEEQQLFFKVNGFKIDRSEVLSQTEIDNITKEYIGKEIGTKDLYKIIDDINFLYEKKGYIVCRAVLPPQTIQDGYIEIKLVEGKTGNIEIRGNSSTKETYIKSRLPLIEGKISNFQQLNKELIWFNSTNDIQLRIEMMAGKKIKTTDYILNTYEPKRNQFIIFGDNSGSKNTGEYRSGINYTNNSLIGYRDQFSIFGTKSKGAKSLGLYYSLPVTKKGSRINLQYSAGKIKIINGDLKDLNIKGKSSNYGFGFSQTLVANEKRKIETSLDWSEQNSSTDIIDIKWVKDKVNKFDLSLSVTSYYENQILYMKHNLSKGKAKFISGKKENFEKYNLLLMYQKAFSNKATFTTKVNAQYAFSDFLPSGEQFYVGGAYSVRGYQENIIGADKGVSINNEFSIPVGQYGSAFLFFDAASLHGKNTLRKHQIYGTGGGYKLNFRESTALSVTFGFPLKKDITPSKVDSHRIHISVNHQF